MYMFIITGNLNARCGCDAFIGQNTCVKSSLIDFVVASPKLFPMFSSFGILDFDQLLYDVHTFSSLSSFQFYVKVKL